MDDSLFTVLFNCDLYNEDIMIFVEGSNLFLYFSQFLAYNSNLYSLIYNFQNLICYLKLYINIFLRHKPLLEFYKNIIVFWLIILLFKCH